MVQWNWLLSAPCATTLRWTIMRSVVCVDLLLHPSLGCHIHPSEFNKMSLVQCFCVCPTLIAEVLTIHPVFFRDRQLFNLLVLCIWLVFLTSVPFPWYHGYCCIISQRFPWLTGRVKDSASQDKLKIFKAYCVVKGTQSNVKVKGRH